MGDSRSEPSRKEGEGPLGSTTRDRGAAPAASEWKRPAHAVKGGAIGKEVISFCEELSLLLECGMPLLRALQTLQGRWRNPGFRRVIGDIAGAVESGRTFSQACAERGRGFPVPVLSMIYAGERSGELGQMLGHIAARGQKAVALRRRAAGTLIYPAFVFAAALFVVAVVFGVISKEFGAFTEMAPDKKLPASMETLLTIGEWARTPGVWLGIVGVLVGLYILYKLVMLSRGPRMFRDLLLVHAPFVGHFVKQGLAEHFSRVLGTLLHSGVPLHESLEATRDTARNEVLASCLKTTMDAVARGEGISDPLRKANCFPPLVYDMCAVGEEAGQLDRVFTRLADRYEEKLTAETDMVAKFVQPLIIIVLALVVGFIVFSFFSMYVGTLGQIR